MGDGGAPNAGELSIRLARDSDVPILAGLVGEFRDHLRAGAPTDADLVLHLPRMVEDPAVEFRCAWLEGKAVGYTQTRFFASIWSCGLEAILEDLYVVPAARRGSVGRALLREALTRAGARGARRFSLNTNERNEAAHALYRKEGIQPETHAVYSDAREIVWSKSLGGN